jgi:hypothetical protein
MNFCFSWLGMFLLNKTVSIHLRSKTEWTRADWSTFYFVYTRDSQPFLDRRAQTCLHHSFINTSQSTIRYQKITAVFANTRLRTPVLYYRLKWLCKNPRFRHLVKLNSVTIWVHWKKLTSNPGRDWLDYRVSHDESVWILYNLQTKKNVH